MPTEIATASIDRALTSLGPNGHLDLSFFGGEPLLDAGRIYEWMAYARGQSRLAGKHVRFNLTTNGTLTDPNAWRVLMESDLDVAVSFDGTPDSHNRHRRDVHNQDTAAIVDATLRQLMAAAKPVRVNMVVRPDTLLHLTNGLVYLHALGVRHVDLSLDLWTVWTASDGRRLETAIEDAAALWRSWLPEFSLNLFDAKVGALLGMSLTHEDTRCGFGEGEIAVAPSGRLYPCERLIGEDRPGHRLQLPGHALEGHDFLSFRPALLERYSACQNCALYPTCDTLCRCSNYIRTGNPNYPDGLLCILNKATARAVSEVLQPSANPSPIRCHQH